MSWSALQLAALPSGPWFIPAVVAISRFLLDGEAAGFELVDTRTKQTVVQHVEPHDWRRGDMSAGTEISGKHRLTIRLPTKVNYLRSVNVWHMGVNPCSTDDLLLECLRPHLISAWSRCSEAADRLVELDWSNVPLVRLGIDARGTIDAGAPLRRGSEFVTGWLNGADSASGRESDLRIADDGSFSILATAAASGRGRAPELHGWLLSRPENHGSDMFLWSSSPAAEPGARPYAVQRPTFAQVEHVSREWQLTPKQRLVIQELVTGNGNKDIAETLSCAEVTVEYHLAAIRRKVGVLNRAALISRFWIDAHGANGTKRR